VRRLARNARACKDLDQRLLILARSDTAGSTDPEVQADSSVSRCALPHDLDSPVIRASFRPRSVERTSPCRASPRASRRAPNASCDVVILLKPRLAPPGTIRVWACALERKIGPKLTWTIGGVPAIPRVLRDIVTGSARPPSMAGGDPQRAFTGVYEFEVPATRAVHEVHAHSDEHIEPIEVRSLPAEIRPDGPASDLNFLLVSCFHDREASPGALGSILTGIRKEYRLDGTLLLGDQVYLDLPTLRDFPSNRQRLAEKFEQDYVRNWTGIGGSDDYSSMLSMAPSASIPDDHEYWNNYPHPSPFIQNSYTALGRSEWAVAARALYQAFQANAAGWSSCPLELTVAPLSMFLADARSDRDEHRARTLNPLALAALTRWGFSLRSKDVLGVFVSGQSLFTTDSESLAGAVGDWGMWDYGDCPDILAALMQAGNPCMLVTGDVHWGRIARCGQPGKGTQLCEVVVSPSALVTTVGVDTVKRIGNWFTGIFGERDPWPRHSKAEPPPTAIGPASSATRLTTVFDARDVQRGDQVAVLSYGWDLGKFVARLKWYPLNAKLRPREPVELLRISI
jgi:hypothetical protein